MNTQAADHIDQLTEEAQRRRAGRRRGGSRRAIVEFYQEVGLRLGLPHKRSRTEAAPAGRSPSSDEGFSGERLADEESSVPSRRVYRRPWLPLLAALVLMASAATFVEWPSGFRSIPVAFRGTWVSAHAGYEGRRLVLTESTVRVIARDASSPRPAVPQSSMVQSAMLHSTPHGLLLHLVYATADGPDTLELTLLTPSTLRLRRPADVVWERLVDQRASSGPIPYHR